MVAKALEHNRSWNSQVLVEKHKGSSTRGATEKVTISSTLHFFLNEALTISEYPSTEDGFS